MYQENSKDVYIAQSTKLANGYMFLILAYKPV